MFCSSSEGGVSGTLCLFGGGIGFSVEEGVSGIKFTMESLESESMTIMSHDTLNFLLVQFLFWMYQWGAFVFLKCVKCH